MGCAEGDFWWDVKPLTDGRAVVVIQSNGPYGAWNIMKGQTSGLSDVEVGSLKRASQLGDKLPESDDVIMEVQPSQPPRPKIRPWHFP